MEIQDSPKFTPEAIAELKQISPANRRDVAEQAAFIAISDERNKVTAEHVIEAFTRQKIKEEYFPDKSLVCEIDRTYIVFPDATTIPWSGLPNSSIVEIKYLDSEIGPKSKFDVGHTLLPQHIKLLAEHFADFLSARLKQPHTINTLPSILNTMPDRFYVRAVGSDVGYLIYPDGKTFGISTEITHKKEGGCLEAYIESLAGTKT